MHNIWIIARHEVRSFFLSPIGYVVLSLFSVLSGWFFFHHVENFNSMVMLYQMSQQADVLNQINLNRFVVVKLFSEVLVLIVIFIPAITMRMFAEEKKQKTMELLLTSPLESYEIILGKYLSVVIFLAMMLGTTLLYPLILFIFGKPGPDPVPIITGYLGLFLVGSCVASVGIFASILTENQIVAFVIGLFIAYLFYIINLPADAIGGPIGELLKFLSIRNNFDGMSVAFIDTRVFIYYLSFIFVWLFLTYKIIEGMRMHE